METLIVAAGVLVEAGRVLLTQRKKGTHLAGFWEFPGGKVDEGEAPEDALVRELREELGITVSVGDILDVTFHRYVEAARTVLLLFYCVHRLPGSAEPMCLDVAAFAWETADALVDERFPAADRPVLRKVRALLARSSEPTIG